MLTNNNDITLFDVFLFLKYLINSRPITIPSQINVINVNTAGKSLRNVANSYILSGRSSLINSLPYMHALMTRPMLLVYRLCFNCEQPLPFADELLFCFLSYLNINSRSIRAYNVQNVSLNLLFSSNRFWDSQQIKMY